MTLPQIHKGCHTEGFSTDPVGVFAREHLRVTVGAR